MMPKQQKVMDYGSNVGIHPVLVIKDASVPRIPKCNCAGSKKDLPSRTKSVCTFCQMDEVSQVGASSMFNLHQRQFASRQRNRRCEMDSVAGRKSQPLEGAMVVHPLSLVFSCPHRASHINIRCFSGLLLSQMNDACSQIAKIN